jgi:putative MATE family efflux protein
MLQNVIAGLQGLIDHVLVGNLLGYEANAAIGVSWQMFLVVIVFMASLFTGQAVLVARYVGAGDVDRVNKTVQQALLTALAMYVVMAPVGYFAAPMLLDFANVSPSVRAYALPFLRINFTFSIGMMLFFMLTSALRAAGDARTPMRLGVIMTILNVVLNLLLIPGVGPIPALGTMGSALGTVIASSTVSAFALYQLLKGRLVIKLSRHMDWRPDWVIIRSLFRLACPPACRELR